MIFFIKKGINIGLGYTLKKIFNYKIHHIIFSHFSEECENIFFMIFTSSSLYTVET